MSILNKIAGIGLMVAGVAIWSIDYFIIKAILCIGTWFGELMNAPADVGTGITILMCLLLGSGLVGILLIGGCVIVIGWSMMGDY